MSKQIHIHLHRAPVKDAAPFRRPNFSITDIAIGGTVIYKDGSGWRMSKAVSISGMSIKLATGKTISVSDVWSTDASDWNAFRNATADAPGTVTQRMKFLKEELAKEKSKTEDAEPLYSESNPATVAHIKSLADRVKSTASQGFSKKGAAKAARALTDAIDALLYERD